MAVVKLSKSGKQVQFIDEEGNMFVTSSTFIAGLLQNRSKFGFVLLSRFPLKVSKDRFKPSPIWDPGGLLEKQEKYDKLTTGNDSISQKTLKGQEEKKQFIDKKVW